MSAGEAARKAGQDLAGHIYGFITTVVMTIALTRMMSLKECT